MMRAAVALLAICLLASGCAGLPANSPPQAVGTIVGQPATSTLPVPSAGREPDLLLRDFFRASSDPSDRHLPARQFLTTEQSAKWDDAASTTIVDKAVAILPEARTADRATYRVRANKVGQLHPGGVYEAAEGAIDTQIELARVQGEWRIDALDPGVVIDVPQFLTSYQRKSLYFLDPSGTTTVPDPRWISASQDQVAAQLIGYLVDGPSPSLAPAVRNELGGKVSLRGPVAKADGRTSSVGIGFGGIRVDLQGAAGLDPKQREMLAAQVIWTMHAADIAGPYVLLADGKPFDDRSVNGWSTADVGGYGPSVYATNNVGLHALRDGTLMRVNDNGLAPVPGQFGLVNNLRSVALSRDGSVVAAVADTGRANPGGPPAQPGNALIIGAYDGTGFAVAAGQSISRPSWARDDNSVWAVVDGTKVIRAVRDVKSGQVSVKPVDSSAIDKVGKQIRELRLSRDGVRAALIVDDRVYVAVVIAEGDNVVLADPRPVAIELGAPALSLDWNTGEYVVVSRFPSDTPVVRVAVDGSRMEVGPGNLAPPVDAVDASPSTIFVADSRAVMRLNLNDEPAADRYWREVPGLIGTRATPVLPG